MNKFTTHAKSVISNTQSLAAKNDHQQILPLHILQPAIPNMTLIDT